MVALDTFYVGRLKGVGAVWQLTAVDVATRTAVVQLIVGDRTATVAAAFLGHLKKALRKHGLTLAGVPTDNGPEFTGKVFTARVGELGLVHHRISPGHRTTTRSASCATSTGYLPGAVPTPTSTAGWPEPAAPGSRRCSTCPEPFVRRWDGEVKRPKRPISCKPASFTLEDSGSISLPHLNS